MDKSDRSSGAEHKKKKLVYDDMRGDASPAAADWAPRTPLVALPAPPAEASRRLSSENLCRYAPLPPLVLSQDGFSASLEQALSSVTWLPALP